MDFCKAMQAQVKSTKGTWSSNCIEGGRVKFAGAKKRLANEEELNMLVASAVAKAMKIHKKSKAKETS